MNEVTNVEDAKGALAVAQATHEGVSAQIKKAEDALAASSPSAAIAGGLSLADASAAHHRATMDLAFLREAREHAWQNVLAADANLKTALVHSQWAAKLDKAISDRIAATVIHEAATEAATKAEGNYRAASSIIAAAYAAGMPKPDFLREKPLLLASSINNVPKMRMRTAEQERELWGRES